MSVRLGAIAWCLGAAWLQTRAVLPHALTWWSALFVTLGMCGVISYVAPTRMVRPVRIVLIVIAAFIAGVAWSAWRAETRLNDALDAQWENREIEIIGIVRGLPDEVIGFGGGRGVRFEFDVEHASSPARSVPSRVSLAWYPRTARGVTLDVPVVAPGERWRLRVKLRRPHGLYNPYGFDLEPWLLERNVRATGSVRASGEEVRLTAFVPSFESVVDRARFVVARHVMDALPNHPYAGVILALVVGDQRAVSADDWTMFNQTGVGHLLSISGLHVTMFAALVAALAAWCWTIAVRHRCAPLMRIARMPFAAVFGFIAAAGYTLISGMQVPAQRTLWMLGIVALGWIVQRQVRPSYLLALAAWIVIAADPWAVTAPGFWLSFIAVACLLYAGLGMMGGARPPWWQAAVHSQLAIAVLLSPVGLLLFQQTAVVGPIANAIAIPVVSFLVTPLALLGGLIGPWLEWTWPLQLAHALFAWTAIALEWLARVPGASLELPKPSMLAVGLAMAGGAWLFAPRGVPGRVGAIALFIPLLLTPEPRPAEGDWRATFLDIGQGTAVVIETARHRLLYDTGPKWSDDADAGQRVVLPHLRAIGARRLDAMVVSHADNDHSGGALAVLDAREVEWLLTSIEHEAPISRAAKQWRRCESGQRWEWDGVRFEVLHPSAESYAQEAKTNARSCVLKIANQHGGLLLTGDIEAAQERALVDTASPMLRADVLAVPHHGSLTSSTEGFVDAVAPRIAIVQAGWFNRFGHPRADVLARYADRGVDIARTDRDGAIEVRFSAQGTNMTRLREQYARYWHGR